MSVPLRWVSVDPQRGQVVLESRPLTGAMWRMLRTMGSMTASRPVDASTSAMLYSRISRCASRLPLTAWRATCALYAPCLVGMP